MRRGYNFFFPLVLSAICFLYILGRAIWVPISHDEAGTFFHYVEPAKFIPFFAHWDANNHILNSALAYFFSNIFGNDLIWLRLPNVLAFILYAFYGWKLTLPIKDQLVKSLMYTALLTAWLPIEFFAQVRGYGLSLGILMVAIYHLFSFLISEKPRYLSYALLLIFLACLANASLSNTFLLILGISFVSIFTLHSNRFKLLTYFTLCGVLPYLALAYYAFEMKKRGLLYYGTTKGFIDVTVRTLSKFTFDLTAEPFLILLCITGLVTGVMLILKKPYTLSDRGRIFAILLLGNAVGCILLELIFSVNYPEDRTGIYFIPFFIFTLGYGINHFSHRAKSSRYLAFLFLTFPLVTLSNLNFKEVKLWNSLPLSETIYEKVSTYSHDYNRPVIVDGYHLYEMSWGYHNVRHGGELTSLIPENLSNGISDFRICYSDACDSSLSEYSRVWENYRGGVSLLKRNEPVSFQSIYNRKSKSSQKYSSRYADILQLEDSTLLSEVDALELDFSLSTEIYSPSMNFVLTARNKDDETIYYDYFSIRWIQSKWDGELCHFIRPVNFPDEASKLVCYFYNPEEYKFEVPSTDVSLLKLSADKN